ncbi:MAG: acyl carrier protein [Actinobacteria bacterium]|nr:acyl carrier protein [Actinomycetota bacterium]
MTEHEATELIGAVLHRIAPEADLGGADADGDLQEQLDIDSMDFLNLVVGIHERSGIDIPERDYPQISTLRGLTGYLVARSS